MPRPAADSPQTVDVLRQLLVESDVVTVHTFLAPSDSDAADRSGMAGGALG